MNQPGTTISTTSNGLAVGADPPRRSRFHLSRDRIIGLTVGLIALLPVARLWRILLTTGANVPSSDDIMFIPGVVGKVLAGGYNWLNFPRDTFQNTHVTIAPGIVYLLMAKFGYFNVNTAFAFGLVAAAAKMFLMYFAFTGAAARDGRLNRWGRWALLLLLGAMTFSVTQISVFEHDFVAVKFGCEEAGLGLCVWSLVRLRGRWLGAALICLGGAMASFSFANGLFLWPLFGLLFLLFDRPHWKRVVPIIVFGLICTAPYIDFLFFNKVPGGQSGLVTLLSPRFIISCIAWPLTNNVGSKFFPGPWDTTLGIFGIILFTTLCARAVTLCRRGAADWKEFAPSISVVVFCLLTLWQISAFRETIAPWYTVFAMDFWIGLAGLAYSLCQRRSREKLLTPEVALPLISAAAIAVLFVTTNRGYSDKSFFLATRTPISASSVRNYTTAPTYAADSIEIWRPSHVWHLSFMGAILNRFGLSVFGPHQTWSLQGDWILDKVDFGGGRVGWSRDMTPHFIRFMDFHRLNLFLPPGSWVSWKVSVPQKAVSAQLKTSIDLIRKGGPGDLGAVISVTGPNAENIAQVSAAGGPGATPVNIPLTSMAGKTVTIRISCAGASADEGWVVLRYPTIDLNVTGTGGGGPVPEQQQPDNTDLSPDFTPPSSGDIVIPVADYQNWKAVDLSPVSSDILRVSGNSPSLEYKQPLDVDLAMYDVFYIKAKSAAARPDMPADGWLMPGSINVDFKTEGSGKYNVWFQLPLVYDHSEHAYTFPMKKFGVTGRLSEVRLSPVYDPFNLGAHAFSIESIGFLLRRQTANSAN